MNIYEKLLAIQAQVDNIIKDGKNTSDKYDFASDESVLDTFRPLMDQHKLLLIPATTSGSVQEGVTRSGTARYLTQLTMTMIWHDVETGEELSVPWYAQGVDLAGEKGVGKAQTYAEKYFLLKFFHVPTKKDDPDADLRTRTGELAKRGTAAAAETARYHRAAIAQMLHTLYKGDGEKVAEALLAVTRSEKRGFAGVAEVDKLSDAALPVIYAKVKKTYEARTGQKFEMQEAEDNADD